jgi:gamma-D-glutamyl-L-lysine dipeptidyl-peptidase
MSGFAVLAFCASILPGAVVVQPVANMYSRPTADSEVVSQTIFSRNVDVLEQKDGWARIRTADDYTGWIPESALRAGPAYAVRGRVAEVQSLNAHLYREPDVTKHAPLLTLPFESKLEVIQVPRERTTDKNHWLQVRLPDDRSAWVQSGDVAFDVKPVDIPQMLALSKRFIGLPYTYGGTSSFGYDCSGLAQMLYRRRGVTMPRDAYLQAAWSGVAPVERKDLSPGDLLYFGPSEKSKKITHTGIYLGDGKFISATCYRTPTTHIEDLNDAHWTQLLVAIRRVK